MEPWEHPLDLPLYRFTTNKKYGNVAPTKCRTGIFLAIIELCTGTVLDHLETLSRCYPSHLEFPTNATGMK